MAVYDQLPVYKKAYDLLLSVFGVCTNMERDIKFTIGEKLKNEIVELLINVRVCLLSSVSHFAKV